jgi:hypothetical protein
MYGVSPGLQTARSGMMKFSENAYVNFLAEELNSCFKELLFTFTGVFWVII